MAQDWEELSLRHDSNVNQMNANQIKLLETKIYKALGEEGNELIRRGQNLQLMQNFGNILKGNTTTKKGYSDTKGRYLFFFLVLSRIVRKVSVLYFFCFYLFYFVTF